MVRYDGEDPNCEIMISMTQTGGRLPVKGKYSNYPFPETMHYANVSVFKLRKGEKFLEAFDRKAIKFVSPIKRERENSGRIQLDRGETYVIVCSTEMPGNTGDLYLSFYIDKPLRDTEIKRVFHPMDKNTNRDEILPYFIPEEAEKLSSNAPAWKLELVRESIPYMMTDEDN